MLGIASPTVVIEEIGPKPVFVSYISRITSIVNVIITRQKYNQLLFPTYWYKRK